MIFKATYNLIPLNLFSIITYVALFLILLVQFITCLLIPSPYISVYDSAGQFDLGNNHKLGNKGREEIYPYRTS